MQRRVIRLVVIVVVTGVLAMGVISAPPAAASPGQIYGPFAGKFYGSFAPRVGVSGNIVVYASWLRNFDEAAPPFHLGVYYRDRLQNTTGTVVQPLSGPRPNGTSFPLAVSSDPSSTHVLYRSAASNLVVGDDAGHDDVFVHNRLANTTERVSVSNTEQQANGQSGTGAISANGRYVAFTSKATNLVSPGTNGTWQVFVRDRQLGTTVLVSRAGGPTGAPADADSFGVSVSDTGRYVAFSSIGTNLVPSDTNPMADVFVRDLQTNTTELVSKGYAGSVTGSSVSPSISADGRFVSFESDADDVVLGDENLWSDVFVRDRLFGTTERVSVGTNGEEGDGDSVNPSMSRDGRFIAFETDAEEFSINDGNISVDIYVRDRTARVTQRATEKPSGADAFGDAYDASISPDGRYVGFSSDSEEFACTGCDSNDDDDVYLKDLTNPFVVNTNVGSKFQGVAPTRLLDTRFGPVPAPRTVGAKLAGPGTINLPVVGAAVPSNATAVVLNVTSAEASTANGYVTVGPKGALDTNTSSLNLQPGAAVPNLVTAKIGADSSVSLYTNTGSVHLIVDLFGYYAPDAGDAFTGLQPNRILDTHTTNVPTGWPAGQRLVGGHPSYGQMDLTVAGVGDVPADARAVVLNVTSTEASTANGYVTVAPNGSLNVGTSNLNLQPGYNVPNATIVKVGAQGKVTLFTNTGSVHLIVDVVGYYGPYSGDLFFPLSPARILDSRFAASNTLVPKVSPLGDRAEAELPVAGVGGVPAAGRAVVLNVTATEASSNGGYTTVWPLGETRPLASSLNYRPGVNVPNLVQTKLGTDGRVGLYNGAGTVQLIADVNGYFR